MGFEGENTRRTTMSSGKYIDSGGEGGHPDICDYNFDFQHCDTQYLTHGIHGYPARMPPQIPKTVFNHYLRKGVISPGDTIFDPFGGSGTTGVEAKLAGFDAELIDINPLAVMLSRMKTTIVSPDRIREAFTKLMSGNRSQFGSTVDAVFSDIANCYEREGKVPIERPEVSSKFEWFPEPQLYQLAHLKDRIDTIETAYGDAVGRFFRVALSAVCREVSYQRPNEFKRYRMPKDEWESHDPDVFQLFRKEVAANLEQIIKFGDAADSNATVTVHSGDSRNLESVKPNSADFVLTSPPYGDHKTTVPYGQYSLDPAVISMDINREMMRSVDKQGLGGNGKPMSALRSYSETLDETICELEAKDGRSADALSFFTDYHQVMETISDVLKPGQPVVLVIANRRMSDTVILTHQITMELLEYLGFELEEVIPRSLPYKKLPSKNSPSNISGEVAETMNDEFLVCARNQDSA